VRGDHTEGRQWLGRALALPDAPMYPEVQAEALTQIAHHTWLQIGAKRARPLVEQALSVARAHDDKGNTAKALAVLGLVLTFEHDFVVAKSTLEESIGLFQEVDDKWGYAHAVICLALGPYMQDDRATSLALHEQALVLFREIGDRYFQSAALRFIGNLLVKQGDWTRGAAALREALILARELGSIWEVAAVLWSLTDAVQGAGDYARAVRLNWAAKNIFESIGTWNHEDESVFEKVLEDCRAELRELEFAIAVEQGRAMTMEQAITYALEESVS